MSTFAIYLLKMILCSGVLFLYYRLFLRNKVFHAYNRFYLLAAVVISLMLPLIHFQVEKQGGPADSSIIQLLEVVNSDRIMEGFVSDAQEGQFSQEQLVWGIMLWVSAILLFFFIRSLIGIYSLQKSSRSNWVSDIQLLESHDPRTPFSFFKKIFWNQSVALDSVQGKKMFMHELAHVREKHSHDKLFLQIVLIVFWYNPVFWLIRNELHLIHEFIADKKAIEDGDTASFASMILSSVYPKKFLQTTNPFFYSPIKRRIAMISKNNHLKVGYLSRLWVLPLGLLLFAAFSLKTQPSEPGYEGERIRVVINAGHGGNDNGATSMSGKSEKELNLELVKKIVAFNRDPKIQLILTRETDVLQSPKEIAAFTQKQNADLFISIHLNTQNPNLDTKESGMEVYVSKDNYKNSAASKLFASALIGVFKTDYGLPMADAPLQRSTGIWVLQEADCPSVLIEAGFISNTTDYGYLNSEKGQEKFARNVLRAIRQYARNLNKENSASSEKRNTDHDARKNNGVPIAPAAPIAPEAAVAPPAPPAPPAPVDPVRPNVKSAEAPVPPTPPVSPVPDETFKITSDSIHFSMTDNEPIADLTKSLYVLDGKITDRKEIEKMGLTNLKSIQILKGQAAIDKYGKDGEHGVVELTRK